MIDDRRALIQVMAKHLPPSSSTLRLLDLGGGAGSLLAAIRPDLGVQMVNLQNEAPLPGEDSNDAVVALGGQLDTSLLRQVLTALRPGGRLIFVDPAGHPGPEWVDLLERSGYTRILVEAALESGGVLARGEKPHREPHTVDRIQQVAAQDESIDFSAYKGRFVYLLIRQTPNKPAWALKPGETVEWQAAAVTGANGPTLLVFSSLPRAVAFMQPAVLAGIVRDIHKIAKFSRAIASGWTCDLLLNPDLDAVAGRTITLLDIDAASAEAPDE